MFIDQARLSCPVVAPNSSHAACAGIMSRGLSSRSSPRFESKTPLEVALDLPSFGACACNNAAARLPYSLPPTCQLVGTLAYGHAVWVKQHQPSSKAVSAADFGCCFAYYETGCSHATHPNRGHTHVSQAQAGAGRNRRLRTKCTRRPCTMTLNS